jgi:hypothetical protein
MNCDQNDCQQFSFITPFFPTLANTLKTKVGDVVGCIFDVECSVGGFLILKQIIDRFFCYFITANYYVRINKYTFLIECRDNCLNVNKFAL